MDHPHFTSLSRTGHVVALLAACVLLAPSAASASRATTYRDRRPSIRLPVTRSRTGARSWTRPVSRAVRVHKSMAGWRRP